MYALTQDGTFESGVYAIRDVDGLTLVQFFVDEDDAVRYNVSLGALDQDLVVTEVPEDKIERMCDLMGYAHTIIEPGHLVVPRVETLQTELGL